MEIALKKQVFSYKNEINQICSNEEMQLLNDNNQYDLKLYKYFTKKLYPKLLKNILNITYTS